VERVGCASSGPVSTQWVMASEQSLPWRSSMFCTKLISDISIYISHVCCCDQAIACKRIEVLVGISILTLGSYGD